MKRISILLVIMVTLSLVFASCSQPLPPPAPEPAPTPQPTPEPTEGRTEEGAKEVTVEEPTEIMTPDETLESTPEVLEVEWKTGGPYQQGHSSFSLKGLIIADNKGNIIYNWETGYVWRTDDEGKSWEVLVKGDLSALYKGESNGAFVVDPTNSEVLYRGTATKTWKSVDGGKSWMLIRDKGSMALAIDAKGRIWTTEIYPNNVYKLFRSEDGGKTWTEMNKPQLPLDLRYQVNQIIPHPKKEKILYVTVSHSATGKGWPYTFKTTDGGESWSPLLARIVVPSKPSAYKRASYEDQFLIDPQGSETIYVIRDGKVWKSSNGGNSGEIINSTLLLGVPEQARLAVDLNNSSNLFLALADPPRTLEDAKRFWGEKLPLPNYWLHPEYVWKLFLSSNAGQSWVELNPPLPIQKKVTELTRLAETFRHQEEPKQFLYASNMIPVLALISSGDYLKLYVGFGRTMNPEEGRVWQTRFPIESLPE